MWRSRWLHLPAASALPNVGCYQPIMGPLERGPPWSVGVVKHQKASSVRTFSLLCRGHWLLLMNAFGFQCMSGVLVSMWAGTCRRLRQPRAHHSRRSPILAAEHITVLLLPLCALSSDPGLTADPLKCWHITFGNISTRGSHTHTHTLLRCWVSDCLPLMCAVMNPFPDRRKSDSSVGKM